MRLSVHGLAGELCAATLDAAGTVADAKRCIEEATGIAAHAQRLVSRTTLLDDDDGALGGLPREPDGSIVLSLIRRHPEQAEWLRLVREGSSLEGAPEDIRGDREVVLAAITRRDASEFRFATAELRQDRDFVEAVVLRSGCAVRFAAAALRADRAIVLLAVRQTGHALQYADAEFLADREVVLEAVRQSGHFLLHASNEVRDDFEVVLSAVRESGSSLCYASDRLKGDRQVVLAAVGKHGPALVYASEELRHDLAVVSAAAMENRNALHYTSRELRRAFELRLHGGGGEGFPAQPSEGSCRAVESRRPCAGLEDGARLKFAIDAL